jgi:hypothetical protein
MPRITVLVYPDPSSSSTRSPIESCIRGDASIPRIGPALVVLDEACHVCAVAELVERLGRLVAGDEVVEGCDRYFNVIDDAGIEDRDADAVAGVAGVGQGQCRQERVAAQRADFVDGKTSDRRVNRHVRDGWITRELFERIGWHRHAERFDR